MSQLPDMQYAVHLFKSGQLDAAAEACSALLAGNPENPKLLLLMAAINQRLSRGEAAIHCLLSAASAFGTDTDGVLQVVVALQRIGAAEQAAGILERLDNRHAAVVSMKAQNAWRLGQYGPALRQFRQLLESWPDLPASYLSCARAELRLGFTREALATLENGLNRFPENGQLARMVISCQLDAGNGSRAIELAGKLSGVDPDARLLSSAIRSALVNEPFDAGQAPPDERRSARISSHQWLLERGVPLAWFGTGTGLLHWAAKNAPADGVVVECGVYHGLSINQLAQWSGLETHGFDSFEGLPENWKADEPAGSYSTGGKLPETHAGVHLHPGWFKHTLAPFAAGLETSISLLHIDCDLYSSTRTALEILGPLLKPGSILVFDDFLSYPGYEQHEFKAANEYLSGWSRTTVLKAAVLLGRSVAFQVE